jgi:PTS system nitrogen regulatory IIA component
MELKIKDLMDLLQVTEKTIYRWIQDNKIPAYKINHQYRFNKAEINEWILNNKVTVSSKVLDLNLSKAPASLADLLKRGGVFSGIKGSSAKEIISDAVEEINVPPEITRQALLSSLIEREEMMPTSIGKGIAIPHARNPIITDLNHESISICYLEKAVDYGAIDNLPVHTVFIVLSANPRRHLEMLAKLLYLCQQEEFMDRLVKRSSPAEIMSFIEAKEKDWKKRQDR